jgi:hypothetical protein
LEGVVEAAGLRPVVVVQERLGLQLILLWLLKTMLSQ